MPQQYSDDEFSRACDIVLSRLAFTVEDWTDPNNLEIIFMGQSVHMSNAAFEAAKIHKPGRKLRARWGRSWSTKEHEPQT